MSMLKVQAERNGNIIIVRCPKCKRRQYIDDTYDISNNKLFPDFVCMAHNRKYSIEPISVKVPVCLFSNQVYLDFI